jgi:hypothetical protein
MTKKEFKENCRFELYTGGGRRINAIHYDWKSGTEDEIFYIGYKYRVYSDVKNCSKADLFKAFYNWVIMGKNLPSFIKYKYAETNQQRFKIPLSLNN